MTNPATLVWFRNDLRLADNAALAHAVAAGGAVVPVFVWAPEEEGRWAPGGASRWWLHHSLVALRDGLRRSGSDLWIIRADASDGGTAGALLKLAGVTGAGGITWNRRYEPAVIDRDKDLRATLAAQGLAVESHNGTLLLEPVDLLKKDGTPYLVFTPYGKAAFAKLADVPPRVTPAPGSVPVLPPAFATAASKFTVPLESLDLLPTKPDWSGDMAAHWTPGEAGAAARLATLVERVLDRYDTTRDIPSLPDGTSSLSPHLHFGEISPRQIWIAVLDALAGQPIAGHKGAETFLKEVLWREFAHHLLYHFPKTPEQPLNTRYEAFPWVDASADGRRALRAWTKGMTGYPIVDAGMRQLWATGWMHNRVRMIVGSFLVKDLRISWTEGAAWFWDTLVDADLASNTMGWQWIAGCGADAAPYFRVFNPTGQGEKFDPKGEYVRRWVPEISALPDAYIHRPWEAPPDLRRHVGMTLGVDYPMPIVDHGEARVAALAALATIKKPADA